MRKTLIYLGVLVFAVAIVACDSQLHNVESIEIDSVKAINLAEDGTYALPGNDAFHTGLDEDEFEDFSNEFLEKESEDGEVVWEFDPAYVISDPGAAEFKVVQSGAWDFPAEGGFAEVFPSPTVDDAEDLEIDGQTWTLIWDGDGEFNEDNDDDFSGVLKAEPAED